MTRRRQPHVQIAKRFARIPTDVDDGRVRCVCGTAAKLTRSGVIHAHRTPAGDDCPHRAGYRPIALDELPPVVISNLPRSTTRKGPRPADQPSRLDAGSACEDCGRWLPGERRLCSRCLRERGNL